MDTGRVVWGLVSATLRQIQNSIARQPRVEYPGANYHVRVRGNARQDIVLDAKGWQRWEEDLALTVMRYGWQLLTYVLMTNYLHLLLRTPHPNLLRGIQYFLSRYANWFNRREARPGTSLSEFRVDTRQISSKTKRTFGSLAATFI